MSTEQQGVNEAIRYTLFARAGGMSSGDTFLEARLYTVDEPDEAKIEEARRVIIEGYMEAVGRWPMRVGVAVLPYYWADEHAPGRQGEASEIEPPDSVKRLARLDNDEEEYGDE